MTEGPDPLQRRLSDRLGLAVRGGGGGTGTRTAIPWSVRFEDVPPVRGFAGTKAIAASPTGSPRGGGRSGRSRI